MVSSIQVFGLVCCAVLVASYPNGAPKEVCRMSGSTSRRPVHGDHMPQWTEPPYKLYHNLTDGLYRPGEAVNVTLEADQGFTFKGFLVTADSSTSYLFGSVNNLTDGVKGVGNCGMTHIDNSSKTSISVVWVPASIPVGAVQFKAVVVQNYSTFWEAVRSPPIQPDKSKFPTEAELRTLMAQAAAARAQAAAMQQGLQPPTPAAPGQNLQSALQQQQQQQQLQQLQQQQMGVGNAGGRGAQMSGPMRPMDSLPQGTGGRLSSVLSRQI